MRFLYLFGLLKGTMPRSRKFARPRIGHEMKCEETCVDFRVLRYNEGELATG